MRAEPDCRFLRAAAERLRPLGGNDVKTFEAFRQDWRGCIA